MGNYVYCAINEYGACKIGKTSQPIHHRMRDLDTTGLSAPLELKYFVECADNNEMTKLETALHRLFNPKRIRTNREFFDISSDKVCFILRQSGWEVKPYSEYQIGSADDITVETVPSVNSSPSETLIVDWERLSAATDHKPIACTIGDERFEVTNKAWARLHRAVIERFAASEVDSTDYGLSAVMHLIKIKQIFEGNGIDLSTVVIEMI